MKGRWNAASGENDMVPGKGHSNQVQDIVASADTLVSCGMDDMVMCTKLASITQSGCVDCLLSTLIMTLIMIMASVPLMMILIMWQVVTV